MIPYNTIVNGECIDVMQNIDDNCIDAIITDLPYGCTQNQWDHQIPLGDMWREYLRITKPNSPVILFSQGMFTAELMLSNPKMWKYNLIWEKSTVTGFLNANRMPLRSHEDIVIFYQKPTVYNPQKTLGIPNHSRGAGTSTTSNYGKHGNVRSDPEDNLKHPRSVIHFDTVPPSLKKHPTEKPVPLMEWLVRTYTNQGQIILDSCCGAGATLVACKNTQRRYIGIEIDKSYCDITEKRLNSI